MRHLITYIISSIISYTVCFGQLFPTDSNLYASFQSVLYIAKATKKSEKFTNGYV